MRKRLNYLLAAGLCLLSYAGFGQISGTSLFVQGQYLEAGMQGNASLGSGVASPSNYHPHNSGAVYLCSGSSNRLLASVYDYGKDGWSTGTPAYMGDYTLPGSPWEGWAVEVNSQCEFMYSSSCNFTGALTGGGGHTAYTSGGGAQIGTWVGTFGTGGRLRVVKEHRIDTLGSAFIVTARFYNTTGTPLTGVYYMRTCDPDNPQSWGGSFTTRNVIQFQNDFYHRVMVEAFPRSSSGAYTAAPNASLSLGTKDCRAKCCIFNSWPMSTGCLLSNVWAGTAGCLGTSYFTLGSQVTSDIAIGLVYNIGTIPANDSAIISYAYIYNGAAGVDSAFPAPQLIVNGTAHDSIDTETYCVGSVSSIPVDISNAIDKAWSWSSWSWAPATGLSTTTGVTNTIDPTAFSSSITYTITGTNTRMGSCANKVFLLTINPISITPPVTRDTTYCQGITPLSITFNVSTTSGTLTWYTSATGGTGSSTAPTISTATAGSTTYWVSQTNSGCESVRVPITITIAPPPVVTLANNGPLCPGDPLTITLYDTLTSTTLTYSWTGPGSFTATTQNILIGSCAFSDSGVYTVVVNNNGCSTNPTSTTVVVHSTPPSPIFTNPTYCQYLSTTALSATGSNILWYTSATGGVGSTVAPTPSSTIAGTFTWYVTQTINSCESARYPVIVTINPKPAPPTIYNNPGEYCPGEPFGPFVIPGGTGSVLWYNVATGGTGSPTAPTLSTTYPAVYTVWATQSFLGCESDRQPITVTVYDSVKAHYAVTKKLGCTADTIVFTNTSYGAISYLWDFGDGYSSASANPVHVYPNQGTYIVKLYAHSAHCVDSTMTTIDTRHPLHANFSLSPSIACQLSPVTFIDSTIATFPHYTWQFGDGTTSTMSNPSHIYTNTGQYIVTLIVKDGVPCSDTMHGYVTVDSLSPISMHISDSVFCRGSYVTLSADYSGSGNTGIVWNFGNGDSILNHNPTVYAYSTVGVFTVTATAHYRVCPDAVTTHTVKVYDMPNIDLGPDTSICLGSESINLTDNINASNPFASWTWNTGNHHHSQHVSVPGTYYATVKIGGCSATDSVVVDNNCFVNLPNCFTPNGDGVNDYFNPRDYFQKGLKSFVLTVYNRWGQVIFETDATDGRGWDGKFNNTTQPAGVYIYNIDAQFVDGQKLNKHGNLTIIR